MSRSSGRAERPAGSGPTCPRVGRSEARGCVIVQGPEVTDPAGRLAADLAAGQALHRGARSLLPETAEGRWSWATPDGLGEQVLVLGELISDPAIRIAHEVPDHELLVAVPDVLAEVA